MLIPALVDHTVPVSYCSVTGLIIRPTLRPSVTLPFMAGRRLFLLCLRLMRFSSILLTDSRMVRLLTMPLSMHSLSVRLPFCAEIYPLINNNSANKTDLLFDDDMMCLILCAKERHWQKKGCDIHQVVDLIWMTFVSLLNLDFTLWHYLLRCWLPFSKTKKALSIWKELFL